MSPSVVPMMSANVYIVLKFNFQCTAHPMLLIYIPCTVFHIISHKKNMNMLPIPFKVKVNSLLSVSMVHWLVQTCYTSTVCRICGTIKTKYGERFLGSCDALYRAHQVEWSHERQDITRVPQSQKKCWPMGKLSADSAAKSVRMMCWSFPALMLKSE